MQNHYSSELWEKELLLEQREQEIASIEKKIKQERTLYINIAREQRCMQEENNLLREEIQQQKAITEGILNSSSWKLTKPLRSFKAKMKNIKIFRYAWRTLRSLQHEGVRATLSKISSKVRQKISRVQSVPLITSAELGEEVNFAEEKILNISAVEQMTKKIAVHLHLYYEDLLAEMLGYINNIPYNFDLYISCQTDANIKKINKKAKHIKNVGKIVIKKWPNRGRDIAPLYVWVGEELEQYSYFLHIHTKKSLYSGQERVGWRQHNLNSLLGSEDLVKRILGILESDRKIGLVFPESYEDVPLFGHAWLKNETAGRALADRLGVEFYDGLFNYPVGSFFWAKTDAVKKILDLQLKIEDFPEETGQNDGTIAHVLERILPFCVRAQGEDIGIVDINDGIVRYGKSMKPFREYFNYDIDNVRYMLEREFDVISFDIFDTLITRIVYNPDDVFAILEKKVEKQFGIKINYLKCRKQAEMLAWEKKQAFTTIYDIYDEFSKVAGISVEMAKQFMELEIETELEICIPRKDIMQLCNYMMERGKVVNLVSDMYLPANIIREMLDKCGYKGEYNLWISCEKGKRKDTDELWEEYFTEYKNCKCVHLGDNIHSDYQLVGDRGYSPFVVLNPRHAFKLTPYYEQYKKYINTDISNSLVLGMIVNGGLFNSPFVLEKGSGEVRFEDFETIGYSAAGPLFTGFIQWLNSKVNDEEQIWFLAREGYLLQKLYRVFNKQAKEYNEEEEYFLASRRAVTVGAIKTVEDLREVLSRYYQGSFSNYLEARLGIELFNDIENRMIYIPEDLDMVMQALEPHYDEIFAKCAEERKTYLKYIEEVRAKHQGKEPVIVDVGYSGTIQYYMAKLLDDKIDGYYLCTFLTKPDKIGCAIDAVYELKNNEEMVQSKINQGQLFLEALLKAPYGQLKCFEMKDEKVQPVFNDDREVSEEVKAMQSGILKFAEQYGEVINEMSVGKIDMELAEDIFADLLFGNTMSEDQAREFSVQDDYCSNGKMVFDVNTGTWYIDSV